MPSCARCHVCGVLAPRMIRSEAIPEQRRRKRRRRRSLPPTKRSFPSSARRVFPTCFIAVSLVISPIIISALQVKVQPPPVSIVGRRKQKSKPPSWIAATTTSSNTGTASGIIMYNNPVEGLDEGSVLNINPDNWLGSDCGSSGDIGGASCFGPSSSSAGTRPLTKVINKAHSGNSARRKSNSSRTALQASQHSSGNGGRRGDLSENSRFGGNGSRRKSMTKDSSMRRSTNPQIPQIHSLHQNVMRHLRQQDLSEAYQLLEEMILLAQDIKRDVDRDNASALIDESIRSVAEMAFTRGGRGGKEAANIIALGLNALYLQLSAQSNLTPPWNAIPRATWIKALRALTSARGIHRLYLKAADSICVNGTGKAFYSTTPADASFGVLQRLISGAGVRRPFPPSDDSGTVPNESNLDERDFSMVLNAFVCSGRMDMAHRVVALQERTESAPPLSPVAYSIMIKGYGKLQDAKNIQMMLSHARRNGITPDTIMYNSLIDAYINCDLVEEAQKAFLAFTDRTGTNMESMPTPNIRSYNTMLKGYARNGELRKALELSQSMDSVGLWNEVTTNTLVKAAVVAGQFEAAEDILAKFTMNEKGSGKTSQHSNMEAYTDLVDGYGKAKMLDKAIGIFKTMRQRGVEPNEYSYTCLISAMARNGKMEQANALLSTMESANVRPTTITYNAFISAALADAPPRLSSGADVGPDSSYLDE